MSEPQFFPPVQPVRAGQLAASLGLSLRDPSDGDVVISGVGSITDAPRGTLTYAEGPKQARLLTTSLASAVICKPEASDLVPARIAALFAKRPQQSFAEAVARLYPDAVFQTGHTGETGVSSAAHVSPLARLEPGVVVEAGAVISPGAAIGEGTVVGPNAVIGRNCQIGRGCRIGAGVTVQFSLIGNRVILHPGVRIGQDGFGYVAGTGQKVPQIGRVIIQDDVEIGANTTVDRGALGDTVIGEGTKIDNLVQIGHNVRIGRGCVIVAQCGISGSVTIGDYVSMGGQVGTTDHISVGDRAMIAGRAGLISDVPAGEVWFGFPAQPRTAALREIATLRSIAKEKKKNHE